MSRKSNEGLQCSLCTRNTVRLFDTLMKSKTTIYGCPNCDGDMVKISLAGDKNKRYPYITKETDDLHD